MAAVKAALLIIDMQNAYFNNVTLRKQRDRLIDRCNQLIKYARSVDMPIFNIRTRHERNQATWTLNMQEDGRGFLFEGHDIENVPGLDVGKASESSKGRAAEVYKTRDSAFYATNLELMLHTLGRPKLILCGVSTHTCIFQTAADAYAGNFGVTLASDAIATHIPELHEPALRILDQEYRQKRLAIDEIIGK